MAKESGNDPWDAVRALPMGQTIEIVDGAGHRWHGTVVRRHELSGDRILPLKLANGYNVGVRIDPGTTYRLSPRAPSDDLPAPPSVPRSERAGRTAANAVALLTTGGTIASRIDYETGGVAPVSSEEEILSFYPDLATEGPVRVVRVLDRLSENIVPEDWVVLAEAIRSTFGTPLHGIVVAHGTDTMGFTAAALSFLFPRLPGPVVLVGAQRSPDRPSSDGRSNLAAAVRLARTGAFGEVVVLMHAGPSDDRFAIHRGTRVRKMHSTRRDAFLSPNTGPLGTIDGETVRWNETPRSPTPGPVTIDGPIDPAGALLWFYPGLSPRAAEEFVRDRRGVILAGTGLGHVGELHLDWIERAVRRGCVVAMTTQCLGGEVDPFVYATGRELVRRGVVFLGDMLPETAYAKLLWALGHDADPAAVARRLVTPVAGEMGDRRRAGDAA